MKKLFPLLLLLGVAALATFYLWASRLPPFDRAEPVELAFEDLDVSYEAVRVKGTAHYPIKMSQNRPATLFRPERTWYIFPLFPPGDTMGRQIKVMVVSPNEPERLVSLEDMTVEGWALPARAAYGPEVEQGMLSKGYSFADEYFVIELFEPEDEGGEAQPE